MKVFSKLLDYLNKSPLDEAISALVDSEMMAKSVIRGVGKNTSFAANPHGSKNIVRLKIVSTVRNQDDFNAVLDLDYENHNIVIVSLSAPTAADTEKAIRTLVKNLARDGAEYKFGSIGVTVSPSQGYLWAVLGFVPTAASFDSHAKEMFDAVRQYNIAHGQGFIFPEKFIGTFLRQGPAVVTFIARAMRRDSRDLSPASIGPKLFSGFPVWVGEMEIGNITSVAALYEINLEPPKAEAS